MVGSKRTRSQATKAKSKGDSKSGYDFIVGHLKRKAKADYAASRRPPRKPDYPVMFGRAKLALGLVRGSARGEGKAAGAKAVVGGTPRTRPSSPRREP